MACKIYSIKTTIEHTNIYVNVYRKGNKGGRSEKKSVKGWKRKKRMYKLMNEKKENLIFDF